MSLLDQVVFIDTETTGLHAELHEIWEIGLIEGDGTEHHWFMPLEHAHTADPFALKIGGYYERYVPPPMLQMTENILYKIDLLTAGKHLVGAIPSFDEERLRKLFYRKGMLPPRWHYHIIDVEALAVGYLSADARNELTLPWKSDEIFEMLGIDPPTEDERHTALGDAKMCMRVFKKVMGYELG